MNIYYSIGLPMSDQNSLVFGVMETMMVAYYTCLVPDDIRKYYMGFGK